MSENRREKQIYKQPKGNIGRCSNLGIVKDRLLQGNRTYKRPPARRPEVWSSDLTSTDHGHVLNVQKTPVHFIVPSDCIYREYHFG